MTDEIYRQIIIDRYKQPRFRGELPEADVEARVSNPLCGDALRVGLRLEDGRVVEARWQGEGCAISQAAADLLSEQMLGKTIDAVRDMTDEDMVQVLGVDLGPARLKCATLGLVTVKKAIEVSARRRVG